MTHNANRDGQPDGVWATAARSPRGEVGVAFGCGRVQVGFILETQLEAFVAAAFQVDDADGARYTALITDAAKTLPKFKETLRRVSQAARN